MTYSPYFETIFRAFVSLIYIFFYKVWSMATQFCFWLFHNILFTISTHFEHFYPKLHHILLAIWKSLINKLQNLWLFKLKKKIWLLLVVNKLWRFVLLVQVFKSKLKFPKNCGKALKLFLIHIYDYKRYFQVDVWVCEVKFVKVINSLYSTLTKLYFWNS